MLPRLRDSDLGAHLLEVQAAGTRLSELFQTEHNLERAHPPSPTEVGAPRNRENTTGSITLHMEAGIIIYLIVPYYYCDEVAGCLFCTHSSALQLIKQELGDCGGWNTMNALVGAGDLNSDAKPDLLARDASGVVWLYPGNGRGGWLTRVRVGGGWNTMNALS